MTRARGARGGAVVAVVVTVLVLVVGGAVAYFLLQRSYDRRLAAIEVQARQEKAALQARAETVATELARDLTRVLATTISDDVARIEHAMLEAQLAAIVRGERLAGVLVVDPQGEVVATTDQRYAGRTMDDAATLRAMKVTEVTVADGAPSPGQIEVAAPLFVGSERVGTVRVFVDLGDLR